MAKTNNAIKFWLLVLIGGLSISTTTLASSECDILTSVALQDVSTSQLLSCRMAARKNNNIGDFVKTYELDILSMQLADDFKTAEKLTSGLLDDAALSSYALKYRKALNDITPFADKGMYVAIKAVYEIHSADAPYLGPLNTYKSFLENDSIPNYAPFDKILDEEKAFKYLTKLNEINESEYIVKMARAYIAGNGTDSDYAKALELLQQAILKYRDQQALNSLSLTVINIGSSLVNKNLTYLAFGRALLKYEFHLSEQKKTEYSMGKIWTVDQALLVAAQVRGYSKEDVNNPKMQKVSDEIYNKFLANDFELFNTFMALNIELLKEANI